MCCKRTVASFHFLAEVAAFHDLKRKGTVRLQQCLLKTTSSFVTQDSSGHKSLRPYGRASARSRHNPSPSSAARLRESLRRRAERLWLDTSRANFMEDQGAHQITKLAGLLRHRQVLQGFEPDERLHSFDPEIACF